MTVKRWVFHPDYQLPFEEPKAVALINKITNWFKPDVICNIGDLLDFPGASLKFSSPEDEIVHSILKDAEPGEKYWTYWRNRFPNAELIWMEGNHEKRAFDYMSAKAPAALDLLTYERMCKTDTLGVKVFKYEKPPEVKCGQFYIHHGTSVGKDSGGSVKAMIDNFGESMIIGHCHRASYYTKYYELSNKKLEGFEIGCACQMLDYTQHHNWQKAMAIGFEDTETGKAHVQLVNFDLDYSCYVGNKRFEV